MDDATVGFLETSNKSTKQLHKLIMLLSNFTMYNKGYYLQVPLNLEPLQACEVSDKRLWIGNLDTRVNEYVSFYFVYKPIKYTLALSTYIIVKKYFNYYFKQI